MKKTKLDKLISDGMELDDILRDNCEDFPTIVSREWLLDFVLCQINEGRLYLARHILDAVDTDYADWYDYDMDMGTLETPTAINDVNDLYDYVED